jgi:pimeloyl-ACP methyl ester carboxylesterase
MLELLPNARLTVLDQSGHMSNLENPDAFNQALLSFVSDVSQRPLPVSRDGGR